MEGKMKKTRSLVLSTALSVSMALLAGCGGADTASTASTVSASAVSSSSSSGEKTKISFMGWGTDSEIKTYQTLIDQFEEKYPDVEIEYIVVADNEFDTKLQTMFGAGEAPDVFYCGVDNMMKYAATGNLYDMTDFVKNNEIFDADNIWPALIDLYKYDGKNQGSGSIYALPKDVSVFPIFYNVDLFKEAGITPPTIDDPWDWNDYLDAAQKLTSGEGDENGEDNAADPHKRRPAGGRSR